MGFRHLDQAGLELLTSGDPPASTSQSTGITGMSHHAHLTKHLTMSRVAPYNTEPSGPDCQQCDGKKTCPRDAVISEMKTEP